MSLGPNIAVYQGASAAVLLEYQVARNLLPPEWSNPGIGSIARRGQLPVDDHARRLRHSRSEIAGQLEERGPLAIVGADVLARQDEQTIIPEPGHRTVEPLAVELIGAIKGTIGFRRGADLGAQAPLGAEQLGVGAVHPHQRQQALVGEEDQLRLQWSIGADAIDERALGPVHPVGRGIQGDARIAVLICRRIVDPGVLLDAPEAVALGADEGERAPVDSVTGVRDHRAGIDAGVARRGDRQAGQRLQPQLVSELEEGRVAQIAAIGRRRGGVEREQLRDIGEGMARVGGLIDEARCWDLISG